MRPSMLKRFIELAHCCRDVQNLHGMYAVYLNQWAVQRLEGLWEKHYAELDQLCNAKSNLAAMRAAALRARSGRGRRLTMRACST